MTICVCKFPIVLVDNREGKDTEYLSMPLEVIGEGNSFDNIPDMEIVETESLNGIIGKYMKVEWQESPTFAKKYDVQGHIVVAGCSEDALQCDVKSVFVVYHPIDEWIDGHIVELGKK